MTAAPADYSLLVQRPFFLTFLFFLIFSGINFPTIRHRKSVILSIGYTIAAAVPITVTTIATCFPFHLLTTVSLEIPAEYASRKVVVTVENTMIRSPRMPRPAFNMICAMSYCRQTVFPPKILSGEKLLLHNIYITVLSFSFCFSQTPLPFQLLPAVPVLLVLRYSYLPVSALSPFFRW